MNITVASSEVLLDSFSLSLPKKRKNRCLFSRCTYRQFYSNILFIKTTFYKRKQFRFQHVKFYFL